MRRNNHTAQMSIVQLRRAYSMSSRTYERVHDAFQLEACCEGVDSPSAKAALNKMLEMEEIHLKLERELNYREAMK